MVNIIEGSIFDYETGKFKPAPGSPLERFTEHVARADEHIDLIETAMIIAAAVYPGLNIGYYLRRIEVMANDVRLLLADETDPHKIIAVMNSYLFNTLGFKGNQSEYNDPSNSFLNDVLERRTGIPITLSLLYIEIGKQVGLPLEGVALPGHFIVRYRLHAHQHAGAPERPAEQRPENEKDILLDPFNAGAILTMEDCARLVQEIYGNPVPLLQSFFHPINNRQFLTRMLNNLKTSYITIQDFEKALLIEQFLVVLNPIDYEEIRDRGAINYRVGNRWRAILDFQNYLRHTPDARDSALINSQITNILKEIARNN
jgi:regulator of sirC expression with transglutaminase-like and TPR domain